MPSVVDQDEFWSPIHEMVSDAVSGKKTSQQALAEAAQKVHEGLMRTGKVPDFIRWRW
jgi:maltose-binding protein MalE